jgi:hypothetical protein
MPEKPILPGFGLARLMGTMHRPITIATRKATALFTLKPPVLSYLSLYGDI